MIFLLIFFFSISISYSDSISISFYSFSYSYILISLLNRNVPSSRPAYGLSLMAANRLLCWHWRIAVGHRISCRSSTYGTGESGFCVVWHVPPSPQIPWFYEFILYLCFVLSELLNVFLEICHFQLKCSVFPFLSLLITCSILSYRLYSLLL